MKARVSSGVYKPRRLRCSTQELNAADSKLWQNEPVGEAVETNPVDLESTANAFWLAHARQLQDLLTGNLCRFRAWWTALTS